MQHFICLGWRWRRLDIVYQPNTAVRAMHTATPFGHMCMCKHVRIMLACCPLCQSRSIRMYQVFVNIRYKVSSHSWMIYIQRRDVHWASSCLPCKFNINLQRGNIRVQDLYFSGTKHHYKCFSSSSRLGQLVIYLYNH